MKPHLKTVFTFLVCILFIYIIIPRNLEQKKQVAYENFYNYLIDYHIDERYFKPPIEVFHNKEYIKRGYTIFNFEVKVPIRNEKLGLIIYVHRFFWVETIVTVTGEENNWRKIYNTK
jgi:hypothetical protein